MHRLQRLQEKLSEKLHQHAGGKLANRVLIIGLSLLVAVAIFSTLYFFHLTDLIEALEMKTYDFRMALQWGNDPSKKPDPNIVIVEFDDPTLSILEEEYGTWPWPRRIHANMMEFFNEAGAKAIAYDMMFVARQKGLEDSDEELIQAFRKYKNVYLSMNFDNKDWDDPRLQKYIRQGDFDHIKPLSIPADIRLKDSNSPLTTLKVKDRFFENNAMTFNSFRRIIPELMDNRERIGFINHDRDPDGVSRGNPLFFRLLHPVWDQSQFPPFVADPQTGVFHDQKGNPVNDQGVLLDSQGRLKQKLAMDYFPFLGLRLCMDLKLANKADHRIQITPQGHLKFPGYDIPLAPNGNLLANWYNISVKEVAMQQTLAKYEAYRERLVQDNSLQPAQKQQRLQQVENYIRYYQDTLKHSFKVEPYAEIPAWEVLTAYRNEKAGKMTDEDRAVKNFLKDKVIFVGTTALSTYDIKTTPIDKVLPGVILQATLFDNLYRNHGYMHRAQGPTNLILTILLCLISAVTIIRMRSAVSGLMTTFGVAALYVVIATLVYKYASLWLNIAMPLVSLVITTTLTFMVKYMSRDEDYKKTYKLATTDGLTGLYNHRFFQEHLAKSIEYANRFNGVFSLVLVDIDFFKKFNDTYGHQTGDQVLRYVSKRLKASVRSIDLVARYGGEEMAIILEKASEQEALEVAAKLVRLIGEEPFPIADGTSQQVTISVGVATYPFHGKTPTELIDFADKGLYRAKENGRNQVGAQYEETPRQWKRN